MPVYEYTCPDCAARFDLRRRMSQRDMLAECPKCQGMKGVRRISLPMFLSQAENGGMQMQMATSSGPSACGSCSATSCASCR